MRASSTEPSFFRPLHHADRFTQIGILNDRLGVILALDYEWIDKVAAAMASLGVR